MASIRKRGNSWQVQIRRQNCPTISRSFRSKTDARHWALQQEARLVREYSPEPSLSALKATKLSDLVDRYISSVCPRKRSNAVEAAILRGFLKKGPSDTALIKLSPHQFAAYRDLRLNSVQPVTVRRELALIRHVLEIARKEWGFPLTGNPLQDVALPPTGPSRDRRLKPIEMEHLFAELARSKNKNLLPLASLALETAMRQGELIRMRWTDINTDLKVVHLPLTKNGYPRTIPLSERALQVLETTPHDDSTKPVFSTTGEAIKRSWRRAVDRSNIVDFHFHDLRHEAISRFFELGLSIPEVALISGHRDTRMLFRYTHLKAENVGTKIAQLQMAIGK